MVDWVRKRGTNAHPVGAVLSDANGPIDLPLGATATLRAKVPGALAPKINAPATIVSPGAAVGSPDRGKVSYTLVDVDLDTPGIYEVDWLVTNPSLGNQVFPEEGYMYLIVAPAADAV